VLAKVRVVVAGMAGTEVRAEDEAYEERIGCEAIGAVHTGAGGFAGRVSTVTLVSL